MKNKALKISFSLLICLTITFSVAINAFSAESKEYKRPVLSEKYGVSLSSGESIASSKAKSTSIQAASSYLPEYYSAADEGFVTSVKDQGSLNTCWAFGATAMLESYLLKNGFGEYDFSEEHLNLWATQRLNGTGWQRDYYDGGYYQMAMGYFTSFSGGVFEEDFPYQSLPNEKYENLKKTEVPFGVTDIVFVTNDIFKVKEYVYNYGAVYAGCSAKPKYFNTGKTAFNCDEEIPLSQSADGHVVTVVGWDDNYSKNNFNTGHTPKADGAWLVKNSWGKSSNENGYYWISYEDKYIFTERFGRSYAICGAKKLKSDDLLFQKEEFGAIYDMSIYDDDSGEKVFTQDMTFLNVFDFSERFRTLDKVIFESESVGSKYTIYTVPIANDKPTEDTSKWTKISGGIIEYPGYHSVEISDYVLPREKCGIAININSENSAANASIGICETVFNLLENKITFIPDSKKNDGFLFLNGNMYEFLDVYTELFNDYECTGSIVIKALTSIPPQNIKGDVNGDGKVKMNDILLMQKKMALITTTDDTFLADNSDVDGNGSFTMNDILFAQKIIAQISIVA